ncbi:MAG: GNAT family N-acetyltransferase [Paracoccus sp. (in: a-proteobacteria)]
MTLIRPEQPEDESAITTLTTLTFETAPHSDGREAAIIERLRAAGALLLSLVAVRSNRIIGHVAFSPVVISGKDHGWIGLGPVSVTPDQQSGGIGSSLIRSGLTQMQATGYKGCVVLGEPAYYTRFGFVADPALILPGVPAEYFQACLWDGPAPNGTVAYHSAFTD